ncbi:cation efflux system protein CzcB [Gemmatimonadetes bacterium T265]|nr:cation efflux system protein CzcB [Gemmatimonadetes bacterium T265]
MSRFKAPMSIVPSAPPPAAAGRDEPGAVSRAPLLALVAAILVVVATLFASGCARPTPEAHASEAHAAPAPPAGTVTLAPAQLAYVTVDTVRARSERAVATVPAQLAFDEDHTARVLSPVAGRVVSLDAKVGDVVRAGQPLAHLLSSDVAQAGADLARAGATARQTETALARSRDLFAHGVIAQKDLQQAETDAAAARAEETRAGLRARLLGGAGGGQTYVLRAPLGGEVIDRQVNVGTEVQPGGTTPLFTVSDLSDVWLTANLYQRDLASVRRGARVTFASDALGAAPVDARVTWIADALDPATRTAPMRAVIPNPGRRLRAAVFGQATLYASDDARTPTVPSAALVTRGGGTVVYVEDAPGRFRRRAVTVGEDDGTVATIVRGLQSGERVVGKGSLLVDAQAERQSETSGPAAGAPAVGGEGSE